MNDAGEQLFFSWPTAVGAILGYALHVVLSWGEWAKLTRNPTLGLRAFWMADRPGQIAGILSVLLLYFSLPEIAQVQWVRDLLGFTPRLNFFSAAVVALTAQTITMKVRNISRRISAEGGVG